MILFQNKYDFRRCLLFNLKQKVIAQMIYPYFTQHYMSVSEGNVNDWDIGFKKSISHSLPYTLHYLLKQKAIP